MSGLHAGLPVGSLQAVTISVVPLPFFHIFFPATLDDKTGLQYRSNQDSDDLGFCSSNEPRHIVLCVGHGFIRKHRRQPADAGLLNSLWGREK
jgi:hypothetical protein